MLRPKIIDTLKDYSLKKFIRDAFAGIVVGIVSLPLAIAFAIASGVTPERGLYTAIIAGFIISVLGGSRVQIGGPTGAFVVIVYSIIQTYGINGLLIATMLAGIFLVILGLLKAGTLIKFIPHSVIVGFTSGIAFIIFSSQISDALGLGLKDLPSEFIEKMWVIFSNISNVNISALFIAFGTILIMSLWPKAIKIPGSIIALLIFSLIAYYFKLPVETIGSRFGDIAVNIPFPSLPYADITTIRKLLSPAFTIAILASIESLLSAVVADGMIGGKHRPNMELVAQGAANIVVPMFGGIPATGAIARTATNIKNGGRSPVAGIVSSIVLFFILIFFGSFVNKIPMAALAGVLIVVAYNMSEWRSFISMIKVSRSSMFVLLTTFFMTILVDLTFAIEMGLVLASMMFIGKMTMYTNITQIDAEDDNSENAQDLQDELAKMSVNKLPKEIIIYEVNGPLFFGAAYKFKEEMESLKNGAKAIVIRMRNVPMMDSSGIHFLHDVYRLFKKNNTQLIISGAQPQVYDMIEKSGLAEELGEDHIIARFDDAIKKALEISSRQV